MEETEIHPTHKEIAALAEKLYLESGSIPGRDEQNWLQAEAQLMKAKAPSKNGPSETRQAKGKQQNQKQSPSMPRAMTAGR